MKERLGRMSKAGFKVLDSNNDLAAMTGERQDSPITDRQAAKACHVCNHIDLEPEVPQSLNHRPLLETVNQLNNPFQDSEPKENENTLKDGENSQRTS